MAYQVKLRPLAVCLRESSEVRWSGTHATRDGQQAAHSRGLL